MREAWLVSTETVARRLGGSASVVSWSAPATGGADAAALAEQHLAVLAGRYDDLRVGALTEVALPGGSALLRRGTFGRPEQNLVSVCRAVRGELRATDAVGPQAVEELAAEILRWTLEQASVHLTVEEFRVVERVVGAPPATFVGRSRLVETGDPAPGGAVDALARTLAVRGILRRDHDSGGWALAAGAGAVVAPLIGSRHVAWLTSVAAPDEEGRTPHGAVVFGRVDAGWSAVRDDEGGLAVTALDAIEPAEYAARWCGVGTDAIDGDVGAVAVPNGTVVPGAQLPGAGVVAAAWSARFVRPAAGGLEQQELAWLRDDRGGLWHVERTGSGVVATPVDGARILALLAEGFSAREEES